MRIDPGSVELFEHVRAFFKDYLPKQKCVSPKTIAAYSSAMDQLLEHIARKKRISFKKLTFQDLDRGGILDFLTTSSETRNWKAATWNLKLHAIRSFLNYVSEVDKSRAIYAIGAANIPERKDNQDKSVVRHFGMATLERLLSLPDLRSPLGLRDMVMMALLFDTGCRIGELLSMRLRDLKDMTETGGIVEIHGKGGKARRTPVSAGMAVHVMEYRKRCHRNGAPTDFLFYSSHSGPKKMMSHDNAQRIVNKYVEQANRRWPDFGHSHINVHAFRHSRAMFLLGKGLPLAFIASFLGHSNPVTTRIYAEADTAMKKKALERAIVAYHPLGKKLKEDEVSDDFFRRLCGLK